MSTMFFLFFLRSAHHEMRIVFSVQTPSNMEKSKNHPLQFFGGRLQDHLGDRQVLLFLCGEAIVSIAVAILVPF